MKSFASKIRAVMFALALALSAEAGATENNNNELPPEAIYAGIALVATFWVAYVVCDIIEADCSGWWPRARESGIETPEEP